MLIQQQFDRFLIVTDINPAGGFSLGLVCRYGDAVDYSNRRKANSLSLSPEIHLGLGQHVDLNFSYNFQRLYLKKDRIYEANLSQLRLVYNFNVRTFVRLILQYMDLSQNPSLYLFPVKPKSNTLFTQFLFSYKINPQTVLFLGYSDNSLGMTGINLTRTNRTFFIKLGYAWTR